MSECRPDAPTERELRLARNLLQFWRENPSALHKFQCAIFRGTRVQVPDLYRGPMYRLHRYAADLEFWAKSVTKQLAEEEDVNMLGLFRLTGEMNSTNRVGPRAQGILEELERIKQKMAEPIARLGLQPPPPRPL